MNDFHYGFSYLKIKSLLRWNKSAKMGKSVNKINFKSCEMIHGMKKNKK